MVKGSKSMKSCSSNMKTVLVILLTVVVIGGLVFLFNYFINSHTQKPTMDHFDNYAPADLTPKSENEVVVALFSADWCPHCQNYKPTWNKLKQSGNMTTSSGKTIKFVDVDCTKQAHPEAGKLNVEGYPTVVAISKSSNKHVSSRETMEGIKSEIDSM